MLGGKYDQFDCITVMSYLMSFVGLKFPILSVVEDKLITQRRNSYGEVLYLF